MKRRRKVAMPQVGNTVYALDMDSAFYGKQGKVINLADYHSHRPYLVEFRNGQVRSFRQGDVWKPSQIEWTNK